MSRRPIESSVRRFSCAFVLAWAACILVPVFSPEARGDAERTFGAWKLSEWPLARSNVPVWPEGEQPPFGTWEVRDGALCVSGTADRWSTRLLRDARWEDVDLALRFRVDKSSARDLDLSGGCVRWYFYWGENAAGWDASVVFRFQDPLHYYRLLVSAARGQMGLWDSTGGLLQVVSCAAEVGKTHSLRLIARGSHILAELDGKRVMNYWDRTLPHGSGQVGLGAWKADVAFEALSVRRAAGTVELVPGHRPLFRLDGAVLYDGNEPICYWHTTREGVLFQEMVKLRPGWRAEYYTAIGPNIQYVPEIGMKWAPLIGKLPGALKVSGQGTDRLVVKFATGFEGKLKADHVCTVQFDSSRGVYSYRYDSVAKFLTDFPSFHSMEFLDPLTYNNRPPGPELKYPWNPAGHKWHVILGPDGTWQRYPMLDYQGQNNNELQWDSTRTFLYPDPAVSPAFAIKLDFPQPENRILKTGLCTWGYDYHHATVGNGTSISKGTVRPYHVTLTGYPPEEARKYFKASLLVPALREERPRFAVFDPRGTDFKELTSDAEARSHMVFNGTPDRSVGHGDSCSARIDGPGEAGVYLYQYMVEAAAKRWWIRGWARSEGLKGRGLQLRAKYSYQNEPEDIFYIGLLGDHDWTYFSFITDVLKRRDCTSINFEVDGPGKVWIDDFAIRHLDEGENPRVTEFKMPEGLEPRTDVLVDLRMDDGKGKAAYDYSLNGHSLFLKGAAWTSEQGRTFVRFDGEDDYALLPLKPPLQPVDGPPDQYKPVFPLKEFTYEFWVRARPPSKPTSKMIIFHYRFNPQVYLDELGAPGSAQKDCRLVFQNDHFSGDARLETRLEYGKWTHIAAAHGGGGIVLYKDGRKVDQVAYKQEPYGFKFFAYKWRYNFGAWYGGSHSFLNGDMGPFRLYTRKLTAGEVEEAYKSGWPTR